MLRSSLLVLLFSFLIIAGCSKDDPITPPAGEVLLAEVTGDSIGVQSGSSSRALSITSGTLNFSDRDSARISFFYSGENNSSTQPFKIFFNSGPAEILIYDGSNLNILPAEQFANITIPSPKNNQFYLYRITAISTGFSYFKFRELKIYKK